ncbi:MAG: TetR/AcrR family transcriptional regulator [Thermoleophilaceae bacterium]|nr:TetR/AcrR family transcriptional regulator [Thermoleophilaceae bacterium]
MTTLGPREQMIQSAALLMREHGVEATSFSQVLEHSGAPRGSIYHHFPGGKAQLVEEATRYAGDVIAQGLTYVLAQEDPLEALRIFIASWRTNLEDSNFEAGCPIVAATLENDNSPAARVAAGVAFNQWEDLLCEAFVVHGVTRNRARSAATLAIAAIEGAVVLARAQRSVEPLDRVAAELEWMVTTTLAQIASPR